MLEIPEHAKDKTPAEQLAATKKTYQADGISKFQRAHSGIRIVVYACNETKEAYIAFRGTLDEDDLKTDARLTQNMLTDAYFEEAQTMTDLLLQWGTEWKFYVTGHSLGGTMATIVMLMDEMNYPLSPRIVKGEVFNAGAGTAEIDLKKAIPTTVGKFLLRSEIPVVTIASAASYFYQKFCGSAEEIKVDNKLIHHHIMFDLISCSFQYGKRIDYVIPKSWSDILDREILLKPHALGNFEIAEPTEVSEEDKEKEIGKLNLANEIWNTKDEKRISKASRQVGKLDKSKFEKPSDASVGESSSSMTCAKPTRKRLNYLNDAEKTKLNRSERNKLIDERMAREAADQVNEMVSKKPSKCAIM